MNLHFHEKLFLLTVDDYKGTTAKGIYGPIYFGLSAGLLADLIYQGKLILQEKRLVVVHDVLIGNDLLDQTLKLFLETKKPHKPSFWLNTLASKKLPQKIADQCVKHNILRLDTKHYLWVSPYTATPKKNASVKYWIKEQLRRVVMAGVKPSAEDILLLNLIRTSTLLNLVFTRDERKWAILKINELGAGKLLSQEVLDTLTETEAALHTAITAMTAHNAPTAKGR